MINIWKKKKTFQDGRMRKIQVIEIKLSKGLLWIQKEDIGRIKKNWSYGNAEFMDEIFKISELKTYPIAVSALCWH